DRDWLDGKGRRPRECRGLPLITLAGSPSARLSLSFRESFGAGLSTTIHAASYDFAAALSEFVLETRPATAGACCLDAEIAIGAHRGDRPVPPRLSCHRRRR